MRKAKIQNLTPIYAQFRSKKLNSKKVSKEEYVDNNIRELFKHWLSQITAWGAGLFILLGILDYVSIPEKFRTFLFYRLTIASVLLIISFLSKNIKSRNFLFYQVLFYIAVIGSGIAIEIMIMGFGGHTSSYYPGLMILGIFAISFIPAGFSFHLVSALLIYGIYLVPILVTEKITGFREFFTANVFLALVLISVLVLRYLSQKSLVNELSLKYDLEQRRDKLETAVQKRTDELSETAQKLLNSKKNLEDKVEELESFYEMAIGREVRMKKLKEEMEELKEELLQYKNSGDEKYI